MLCLGATSIVAARPAPAQEPQSQQLPGKHDYHSEFAGMQRVAGEVTAIAGQSVTIKAEDGTTYQVVTTDNTRMMRHTGGAGSGSNVPARLTDIKAGDGVMAFGMMDAPAHTLHAAMLISTDGAVLKALHADLGKTYIVGRVVSVDLDNATMSVLRPDGATQTIGFDESTSFKRGHGHRGRMGAMGGNESEAPAEASDESITLADIHPGDNVSGKGALKNGTFVPAELTVSPPRRVEGGPMLPSPGSPQK
jgi:hypothetical protein